MRTLMGSWKYTAAGPRDHRLDLLRGYAVFAMAVDHIGGGTALHLLTGGNRFFVSAAEAFVLISGVTVGMVYGRYPGAVAARQGLGRAWTLYAVAIWLGLAFAAGAALLGLPKGAAFAADPARFVRDIVLLRRTFYLVDVMLLYAFLMALAPLAIWLLKRGWWPVVVLVSATVWLDFQLWPSTTNIPWYIVDNAVFQFAAWQLLFFAGLTLGFHRDAIGERLERLSLRRLPGGVLGPLLLAFGGLVWLHVTDARIVDRFAGPGEGARLLDTWFNKSSLPLPRLVATLLVFALAWTVVSRAWAPINRALGPLLLPLGRAALYAYAAHVVIVFGVEAARSRLQSSSLPGPFSAESLSLAIELLGLVSLWIATRFRVGQRFVSWLGSPPIGMFRAGPARATLPKPAFSLVAVGLLGLGAWQSLVRESVDANTSPAAARALSARRQAYNNPVTTVTPSRLPRAPVTSDAAPGGAAASPATDGTVFSDTFFSKALNREMAYAIYLPAAYTNEPTRALPVLYMLHGGGGDYTEWARYGLPETAGRLIASNEISPLIIVMPEGDLGYWVNGFSGKGEAWDDYVMLDLLPHIEAKYGTVAGPAGRAIGGISRGAFGAFNLALKHPGVFGAVGVHSPALGEYADVQEPFILEARFAEFDPISLARSKDLSKLPAIYLDIGSQDDWLPGAQLLHAILQARDVPHTFEEFAGGHSSAYWETLESTYLVFYDTALRNYQPRAAAVPAESGESAPVGTAAVAGAVEGPVADGGGLLRP